MNSFHVQLIAANSADLGTRFDEVCQRLDAINRLHLELDGSFVWVDDEWQVDGMIYDRDDRLRYVELKGYCPLAFWKMLTNTLCNPNADARVICLLDGGLYDLQTFEGMTWP